MNNTDQLIKKYREYKANECLKCKEIKDREFSNWCPDCQSESINSNESFFRYEDIEEMLLKQSLTEKQDFLKFLEYEVVAPDNKYLEEVFRRKIAELKTDIEKIKGVLK